MMSFHFSVFFLLSNMECVVANSNYRPFSGNYTSTVDERYATNGIDELQVSTTSRNFVCFGNL